MQIPKKPAVGDEEDPRRLAISSKDESEKKRRIFPFHYNSAPFDCYTLRTKKGCWDLQGSFYGGVKQKSERSLKLRFVYDVGIMLRK